MEAFLELLRSLDERMLMTTIVVALGISVAIVSIICSCILQLKKISIKHAERLAKINAGIDPGDESEAYEKDKI